MDDTIELRDGWIADRLPWEDLLLLVDDLFPDPLGDDDGDEAELRDKIIAVLAHGGKAFPLGTDWGLDAAELMKLKRCDEAAERCKIRRPG